MARRTRLKAAFQLTKLAVFLLVVAGVLLPALIYAIYAHMHGLWPRWFTALVQG
jgi:hypothetical protein